MSAELDEFIDAWPGADPARVRRLVGETLVKLRPTPLERRWYESLLWGEPDYGVYSDPDYIAELWASWIAYSRRYLKDVRKLQRAGYFGRVSTIVDLGCGMGLSTHELALMWPYADVYGTNLPGPQTDAIEALGRVRVEPQIMGPADLVFASEYFEHFRAPFDHLHDVLHIGQPRYLVVASTFGRESVGHFPQYLDLDRAPLDGRGASRRFGKLMREAGYRRLAPRFWNDRPAIWERP